VKEEPVEARLAGSVCSAAEDAAAEATTAAAVKEDKIPLSAGDESPVAEESDDSQAEHKEE